MIHARGALGDPAPSHPPPPRCSSVLVHYLATGRSPPAPASPAAEHPGRGWPAVMRGGSGRGPVAVTRSPSVIGARGVDLDARSSEPGTCSRGLTGPRSTPDAPQCGYDRMVFGCACGRVIDPVAAV